MEHPVLLVSCLGDLHILFQGHVLLVHIDSNQSCPVMPDILISVLAVRAI